MEEKKNEQLQTGAPTETQNGGNGGGRRRRRRHRGGGNGGNNSSDIVAQEQTAQQQPQKTPKNGQNNNANNGQRNQNPNNGQQNQGNPKGGKQKNKDQNKQNQQQPQQQNKQNKPQNKQKGGEKEKTGGKNNGNKQDENRKDTYVYMLDGNLYINLTNKCSNACDFCVRNERSSYYGNYLWIRHGDPTAEKVIAAANVFGDLSRFKEVVFCGFGEPTYKVAEILTLCDFFHSKGLKTRLNTNGQGNLINKRDITPELKDKIDFVNISLNASCVEKYQPICRSQYGEAGFAGLIDFAKSCRKNGIACRFSIVDCIGEDEVEACKRLADSVRIPLYVRKYITDS